MPPGILHFVNILTQLADQEYVVSSSVKPLMFSVAQFPSCALLVGALPSVMQWRDDGAFPTTGNITLIYIDRLSQGYLDADKGGLITVNVINALERNWWWFFWGMGKNSFLLSFMASKYIKMLHFQFVYFIWFGNELFFACLSTEDVLKLKTPYFKNSPVIYVFIFRPWKGR